MSENRFLITKRFFGLNFRIFTPKPQHDEHQAFKRNLLRVSTGTAECSC